MSVFIKDNSDVTTEPILNIENKQTKDSIFLSFIIATLDDNGDLARCLQSLSELEKCSPFEVIVVDQNGDDRLVETIVRYRTHFILHHEQVLFRGASRARNFGAKLARGRWLSFIDDDCFVLQSTLRLVENAALELRPQVITGRTIDDTGNPNLLRWGSREEWFTRHTMFRSLSEATLFVSRDLFFATAGFDEHFGPGALFPAAEGIDLMERLFMAMKNPSAYYSPRISIVHPSKIPPWSRWAASRFYSYACGDGALIAKSMQPHMLFWGMMTLGSAILQLLNLQGRWRTIAYSARILGLFKGFLHYLWMNRISRKHPPCKD